MGKAQRTQIVEAEDVVGVRMGVEDGVDVADAEAQRLLAEVRAGVDKDTMRSRRLVSIPGLGLPFDGDGRPETLIARIGGGADAAAATQRGHAHGRATAEKQDAGVDGRRQADAPTVRRLGGRIVGAGGDGVGDLHEHHAQLEERVLQQTLFLVGEIALGLFDQDAEHVDALARAEDIDAGLLAGLGAGAHLQRSSHVDGLHQLVEVHLRAAAAEGIARAGIGLGDHVVELLRGGAVVGVLRGGFGSGRLGRQSFLRSCLDRQIHLRREAVRGCGSRLPFQPEGHFGRALDRVWCACAAGSDWRHGGWSFFSRGGAFAQIALDGEFAAIGDGESGWLV